MARKKTALVLEKLAKGSGELASMVAELCGKPEMKRDGVKSAHWSRRFAASGKHKCAPAPRIRLS